MYLKMTHLFSSAQKWSGHGALYSTGWLSGAALSYRAGTSSPSSVALTVLGQQESQRVRRGCSDHQLCVSEPLPPHISSGQFGGEMAVPPSTCSADIGCLLVPGSVAGTGTGMLGGRVECRLSFWVLPGYWRNDEPDHP